MAISLEECTQAPTTTPPPSKCRPDNSLDSATHEDTITAPHTPLLLRIGKRSHAELSDTEDTDAEEERRAAKRRRRIIDRTSSCMRIFSGVVGYTPPERVSITRYGPYCVLPATVRHHTRSKQCRRVSFALLPEHAKCRRVEGLLPVALLIARTGLKTQYLYYYVEHCIRFSSYHERSPSKRF